MINYKGHPFYLTDEQTAWVENTCRNMTLEEKVGQLFCPIIFSSDEEELKDWVRNKHIGGALYREGAGAEIQKNHRVLQENAKIPLLLASNLESGGTGSALEGTTYGRQMLAAATGDVNRAYQLGKVSCREGAAVGVNWAFAPVVDIDYNFRNPITNVRTYGNDPKLVKAMGAAYLKGAKEEGVATAVKHFPGDGVDERDQHLLTSVNSLSCSEWDSTYGEIYKSLIEAGTLTVMAGHIAMPAYEEYFEKAPVKKLIPATLSKNLLQKLLREKLGFQGLICTDATPMVGFCAAMDRKTAVPTAIENGCDMFLFNKDFEEDFGYMMEGLKQGILSRQRLEEAVLRILAVKAALGLLEKQKEGTLVPSPDALSCLKCEQHDTWARECADAGVTLVKDTQNLLPLDVKKQNRVLLEIMGDFPSNDRVYEAFASRLTKEGFTVIKYVPEDFSKPLDTVEELKQKYDLVCYIGNIETASNKTVSRLNWYTLFGQGNNMPWFVKEVPTLFVSVGNPYHLLDAPMIPTYINGYCNSDYVIEAVIEKLMGQSPFKGKSPVDAFCGREDTKY